MTINIYTGDVSGEKEYKKYGILAILIILAATSQTLGLKADIGVGACWDAVSLNIYQLTGLKVGTFSMAANLLCVAVQILILKKDFPPIKFLQIPVAVIYGIVINFVYYHILTFELESYWIRMIFWLLSNVGLAVFIGAITVMDVITIPVEGTCYTIEKKFGVGFSKCRFSIDAICIIVSLALSAVFGLSLKIREGTVLGMLMLAPLMGWCMKWEKCI